MAPEAIDLLPYIKKRDGIRKRIQAVKTEVNAITVDALTLVQVNLFIKRLDTLVEKAEELQDEILSNCDATGSTTQIEAFAIIEREVQEINTILYTKEAELSRANQVPHGNRDNSNRSDNNVRLPRIDLPTFDGRFENWSPFHDLFLATIHNNASLTDAQKLQYLKSSLKGDVAGLIKSMQITDANYTEAFDILKKRFDNKREIISSHVKRLFGQPALTRESACGLQKMLDTTNECIRALTVLQEPTDKWDTLLIHLLVERLDNETKKQWALTLKGTDIPTFRQLTEFIELHIQGLMAGGESKTNHSKFHANQGTSSHAKRQTLAHHASSSQCGICMGDHFTFKCQQLLSATLKERQQLVKQKNLCFNCLRHDHRIADCKSSSKCRKCNMAHLTLLHQDSKNLQPDSQSSTPPVSTHVVSNIQEKQVLLLTALVDVKDSHGNSKTFRMLIDPGSQASFATEKCAKLLRLKRKNCNTQITGLSASSAGTARGLVEFDIHSRNQEFRMPIQALVLNKITGILPKYPCNPQHWRHLHGLQLADPRFSEPGSIDILLGADYCASIMTDGIVKGTDSTPYAQNSVFGWLVSGNVPASYSTTVRVHHVDCDTIIRRFWELEEVPAKKHFTPEELACEKHFAENHLRDSNGRYVVKLPLTSSISRMGNSVVAATNRFKHLERRLSRDPARKHQYIQFMHEYLKLHHMEQVPEDDLTKPHATTYYLPHHCVIRDQSSTTKLRVVFDGSAKSTTGISINDCMMVGPTIQDDVFSILLRFRTHIIALKADISKMYRQFRIHNSHADFQRIVWRDNPHEELKHYRLLTVTYGTAAAPFLATRCLHQLADDESKMFPEASRLLKEDFYVDDLLGGAATEQQAITLQQQLSHLVEKAGMELRKWASSSSTVMSQIPSEYRESEELFTFNDNNTVKALGIQWSPSDDSFQFHYIQPKLDNTITKRHILSEIGKIFDPLGFLSPTIIQLKILIQDLWKLKVGWDDELAPEIASSWDKFCEQLSAIGKIRMPRCISFSNFISQEIHGFSDASSKAFSAVVFLRSKQHDGSYFVRFIAAKSKVAPINTKSIPRLELCGALLLAKLIEAVKSATNLECKFYAWTDSTTVLNWLAAFPGRWTPFVANRVAEIQQLIPRANWHHVRTEDNPADCASRGMPATELQDFSLWWNGPAWLREDIPQIRTEIRSQKLACECLDECTCVAVKMEEKSVHISCLLCIEESLLNNCSTYSKLIRSTAFAFRFLHNCRNPSQRKHGNLACEEISHAENHWIKAAQEIAFGAEIRRLKKKEDVPVNSKLSTLTPYIDECGLLRVGGRLQRLNAPEERKHPVILPHDHKFTTLLIQHMHLTYLHGGIQLLWGTLQQKFWILRARDTIRYVIRKCVTCRRHRAETSQQLMGSIPSCRLSPGRAFLHCGVDYAGPFSMRIMKGRSTKTFKAYFAIFVCMTTKAVHLEAVGDLSTEAFIAAFRRFSSRRGVSNNIYSDCGTNFVGADAELKTLVKSTTYNNAVADDLASHGITWHFNPPAAPHHGGLWEAGVKSVKYHFRRVVGNALLTFEEFTTILCQIEACLNSRPLSAMSNDPADLTALTPGHFLIGMPINAVPDADSTTTKMNRLSRWQYTQQIVQHFWRRWSAEHVISLQQRFKWKTKRDNIEVGDLVLVKDEHLPPTKWKLGRVIEVFPGKDKQVRVAKVKTQNAEYDRPIVKLCPILKASD